MKFINVKKNKLLSNIIRETFSKNIEPLYGDQTAAINKILDGKDRCCDVLLVKNKPAGFIVYKTILQNEFNLENAFELKTAFIFDAFKDKSLGRYLFIRADELARKYRASHIYATVSKEMTKLFYYLKYLGWQEISHAMSRDNAVQVIALCKAVEHA